MGFLHFGSGGGLAIALVLDIIALSTPGWIYAQAPASATGLFYYVSGSVSGDTTKDDSFKVAISFLIIAGFFLLVGVILCMMSGAKKEDKRMGKLGGICGLAAGVFITVGMATFTGMNIGNIDGEHVRWGYSYGLGWGAMVTSFLAGAPGVAF